MPSVRVCHNHNEQPSKKCIKVWEYPDGQVELFECPICGDKSAFWVKKRE